MNTSENLEKESIKWVVARVAIWVAYPPIALATLSSFVYKLI